MKISNTRIIELLGIFGVVASLVFVGMQLMLDRRIAIADQYQARTELRMQILLGQFENDGFIRDFAARWETNRPNWWNAEVENAFVEFDVSMAFLFRLTISREMYLITMDNNYYQYQQGLLEQSVWDGMREVLGRSERNSMLRAFSQGLNLPSLNEVIDEISTEIQYENQTP
jgi:hypothetical protein